QRIALRLAALKHLLDQSEHAVLIEAAFAQIGFLPAFYFQLPFPLSRFHIDPGALEYPQMFGPVVGIDNVERLIASVETLRDIGQEYLVLLVFAVEEGADEI